MKPAAAVTATRAAAGFTLLELLVVLGLLGVLFGLGIGFLRSTADGEELAVTMIRDRYRLASLTARRRGLPTQVVLDQVSETVQRVRARTLYPVGHWHFEENERYVSSLLEPQLGGVATPGRFGNGRRPIDVDGGPRQAPLLELATRGHPLFSLHDGFALRLDVFLERYDVGPLVRLGRGLIVELIVDELGAPQLQARMTGVSENDGPGRGGTVTMQPPDLRRWTEIEVFHDGARFGLRMGGREPVYVEVRTALFQEDRDSLIVGASEAPFPGIVDEVRLLAYELEPGQEIPEGVEVVGMPRVVTLDQLGELEHELTFELLIGDQDPVTHVIRRTGVVE